MVPVEAVELLGGEVQYTEEMPVRVPWCLPSARSVYSGDDAPVLLSRIGNTGGAGAGWPQVND